MALDSKVKSLYDAMKADGADVGTEQEFNDYFFKPGKEGYENRHAVWKAFMDSGADIGASYEEFGAWLGLQAATKPSQQQAAQAAAKATAPVQKAQPKVQAQARTQPTNQQPTGTVAAFKLRRGGHDFYVTQQEVNEAGGLGAWAAKHPGAPVRVYMHGDGFTGHVDLSEASKRRKEKGYKYTLEMRNVGELDYIKNRIYEKQEKLKKLQREKDLEKYGDKKNESGWDKFTRIVGGSINDAVSHRAPKPEMNETPRDKAIKNLMAELSLLEKSKVRLEAARDTKNSSGFKGVMKDISRGITDTLKDPDFWTNDVASLHNSEMLDRINQKIKHNEELTDEEYDLAYASMLYGDVMSTADVSHTYTAGQVGANMIPFMLQMAMNPASGFAKGLVKRYGKNKIKKLLMTTVGDVAESAVLTNTLQVPGLVADVKDRARGYVEINDGKVKFEGGETLPVAIAKGEGASIIENYTEKLGEYFGPIWKLAGKGATKGAKAIGAGRMVDTVSKMMSNLKSNEWIKVVNNLNRKAKFNGSINEMLEEESGIILNSIFVGDNELSDLTDLDTQIDILLGVGLFGGAVSGVKAAGYPVARRRAKNRLKKADEAGASAFSTQWADVRDKIDLADESNLAQTVAELLIDNNGDGQKSKAIADYALAMVKSRGLNLATLSKMEDSTSVNEDGEELNPEAKAAMESLQSEYDEEMAAREKDVSDVTVVADVAETQPERQPIGQATMKFQDRPVEVLSGHVVMTEDGKMVDVERSDKTIVVRDPATGKTEMVSPEAMLSYEDVAPKSERQHPFKLNDEFSIIDPESGQPMYGIVTGEKNEDDKIEIETERPLNGSVSNRIRPEELEAMLETYGGQSAQEDTELTTEASSPSQPSETPMPKYSSGSMMILDNDGKERRGFLTGDVDDQGRYEYYFAGDLNHLFYATEEELDNRVTKFVPDRRNDVADVSDVADEKQNEVSVSMPTGVEAIGAIDVAQADGGARRFTVGRNEDGELVVVDEHGYMWAHDGNGQRMEPYRPGANVPVWTEEQIDNLGDVQSNDVSDAADVSDERVGRSLNSDEARRFIDFMEASAEVAPELKLTPENWNAQFGEDGIVNTPIGAVKQGDNQYLKLAQQGRNGKLGMIKPTLEHPFIIIEDERASNDKNSERDTSYVFIRTFLRKDGSRYYHFASVTVSKDGKEVVISSQERSANRISKLLQQGKVAWIDERFGLHPKSQIKESVPLNDSNKPTSTDNQLAMLGINSSEPDYSSDGKDSDSVSDKQVSEAESSASALERLPRDEKGQPVFERAENPEAAWDALVEFSDGDVADAKEMADIVTEQKRKALEKLQKQKPKGASLAELRESQKVIKAAREQAEQEYNFWQQMAGVEQLRQEADDRRQAEERAEANRAEAEEKMRKAALDKRLRDTFEDVKDVPEAVEVLEDMDPRDIYEAAAQLLSGQKVLWGNAGVKVGARSETGFGEEERRRLFGLFASEANGGKSLSRLAEDAMKQQCETYGIPYDNQDARNALIDVISGARTVGDIRNYIANNRIDEARRLAEAKRRHEEEQYDEFCRQEYHLSAEEVEAYEDQLLAKLSERDIEFDANEYNDYIADEMARAAEITEQQKNGTEDNTTRRRSTPGDRRVQENDTEGKGTVSGRGYEVLPESRADQSSGAAADGDRSGIQPTDGFQGDGPTSAMAQGAQRGGIAAVGRRKADDSPYGGLAEEVTSAIGPFGKIYTQFRGKPREAVTFLLAKRDGEAIGALHHKDVGEIDLVWGEEGSAHSDGFGLAKLAKYHPEVLFNLQEILNDMAVTKRSANRVQLESEKYKAAVRLTWDNQKKTWLLTMFEKKNSVLDNTTDTDKTHKGNGNDTATPENTVVSDRKDIDFASDKQGDSEKSSADGNDASLKLGAEAKKEAAAKGDLQAAVEAASAEVNTEPTEGQKKAGNYKKGHVTIGSFDITIENPAGSVRRGVDADGKEWSTTMANAYGEIRGTQSVDGDPIDVFLATDMDAWNGRKVFVVDQTNADGSFDEHKVMLGFNDKDEAMTAYLANYDKTWADTHPGLRISEANIEDFQKWVESSHRKTKAFADYSMVKGTAEAVARRQKDEAELRTERPERGANYDRLKSDLVGFAKKFKDAGTANIPAIEREMSEWMSKQTADDIVDLDARMLSDVCNEAGLDKGKAWAFRMSVDHATPKGLIEEVFKIRNDRRAQIAPRGIADVDGFDMLSPESQAVVEHYLSEYGSKAIRVITGMDDIRALGFPKEVSEAFEEVVAEGGIPALYNSFDKKIYIFADVFNSARRDDGHLFHENVHGAIDECGSYPGEFLSSFRRKVVSSGYKPELFRSLESMLKDEYDKDSVDEEFLAYTLQWTLNNKEREPRIMELLGDEEKEFIYNNILNKIRYAQRRRTRESTSEEVEGHETLHAARQRADSGDGVWFSRQAAVGDERRGNQGVAGESADGERSEGHGSLGADVYDAAKGLLEAAGVVVVEVSDTEAAEMLNRRGSDVPLMGSRTDRKMAKIAEYFKGRELDENQQAVVDVFSGKRDNVAIEVERPDGKRRVVMRQGNELKAGAKHSLFRHYETSSNYIAAEDIALIPEVIAKGEREEDERGIVYNYTAPDSSRLKVTTNIKNGREEFTNLFSNRKPLTSESRRNTQLSARATNAEVSDAKINEKSETDKPQFFIRTYHGGAADFDKFDFSYVGSGEGAQAYGWGGYVTEVKGIGRMYATAIGGKDLLPKIEKAEGNIRQVRQWLREHGDFDKYVRRGKKHLRELQREYRAAEKDGNEKDMKFYHDLIEMQEQQLLPENHSALIADKHSQIADYQKELDALNAEMSQRCHLYTVRIPDDNGSNYLDWDGKIPAETKNKIILQSAIDGVSLDFYGDKVTAADYFSKMGEDVVGFQLYRSLTQALETPEQASMLLSRAGLIGIKYAADHNNGGRADGKKNYVVFNESDMKIVNHVRFLRMPTGVVYGWTVGGKVYLNRDAMNPETPLHEYTHLWDEMVRRENPELWARGKELMKQTPLWQEVIEDPNYADIRDDEDAVASEVHSRLTGKDGARILSDMIEDVKKDGPLAVAERVTLVERLKRWLGEMFTSLKKTLSQWSKRDLAELTVEDFVRMTLRDLAEGINPKQEMQRGDQMRMVTKENPMLDDYHTGIRTREDVKTFDEMLSDAESNFREYGSLSYPDMDIEMLREAKRTGEITVYSSKPIRAGHFVTPSRMNAEDYAGGEKVYSKKVSIEDIAWISEDEGQFAPVHAVANDEGSRFHAAMSRGREEFDALRERAISERGVVMPGLNEAEVRVVEVPRHDFTGTGKEALQAAEKWAKEKIVGMHAATDSRGNEFEYSISNDAVEKYVSRSATDKSKNIGVHLAALKKLPEIISESVEAEVHPDYKKDEKGKREVGNGYNPSKLIHRFYGAINLDGTVYRVKTTIEEHSNKSFPNAAHNYEVTEIEAFIEETMNAPTDGALTSTSSREGILGVAKLMQGVEKSYDPGKKLLDESAKGEIRYRQGDGYGAYSDAEVSFMNDPVSKVVGKNRFSKKRQAEFAVRERQRMADRIQCLAERMHLGNVEVVTDVSQLDGRRATAKGFYNKRTDKITIVIPNNVSSIDAEQTLLHEAVAHYGLRKLFGEHFDTFLDNVYQSADESIRKKIAEMAAQNGWNFRTATEEYLAGLAEDTNFEDARGYASGWWQRVKRLFIDMLERIGFEGFRDKVGVVLTDNELRYILWRSYENLAEPGRYRSILGEAKDVAMQSDLKVGNYAERGIEAEYAAEPSAITELSKRFDEALKQYEERRLPQGFRFELGMPSAYLKSAGFPNLPICMRATLLARKAGDERHPFEASDLKGLVEAIQQPIAIFEYSKPNMRNLIVDVKRGDKHFLVGMTLDYKAGDIEINSVSGLFPKESHEWIKWIQDGKAIRIDQKEKVQTIIDSLRTNPAESERIGLNLDDVTKVVKSFENPTIEEDELSRPGDFSPRDKAIARDAYEKMVSSSGYQFQEAVQDSMLGLKKLYDAVLGEKTRIEDIAGHENAYLFENRMSSMNSAEQHEYFIRYMKPLLKEIGNIAGANTRKRQELADYIMAKHGLERNQYMRARAIANGKNANRDFSGLMALTGEGTLASAENTAQKWADDYESLYDTTSLWEAINNATKATLEKIYQSGMLSKERYEKIRGMYKYYIPLRGWEENTSDDIYGYLTNQSGPIGGRLLKKAEGRSSKADDPIATIAMMSDDAIRQGNRNLMKQRFLNFVLNHPSDLVSISELWLEYDAVNDEWRPVFPNLNPSDTAQEVTTKIEAFEQRMEALHAAEPKKYKKGRDAKNIPYRVIDGNLREHQILIMRNGQTFVATINGNPRAAQALNGLTNPDVDQNGVVGDLLKAATWVNRQLSAAYTTRNPDFVVGNFVRDMLYSNCMTWVKEGPRYALRFHKNFGQYNPATMRWLLGKWENGSLDMNDNVQKLFYEFMKNGGETGYTNIRDIEGHKKAVASELKKQGNIGRKAWTALGMQVDLLNRSVENCARFAAFVTSREFGRSIDRSIYDAKEVSVNFNKKGSGAKMLHTQGLTKLGKVAAYLGGGGRLLYVFWNAGVQGLTNISRQAKRHPTKFTAGAAAMFTLGYVIPILAHMLGDGDDDDKNAYYNLAEYVRRSHICFRAGDQWITIPLPIEYRAVYGMGELAYGAISGNEKYTDSELGYQMAAQVSQILPIDLLEGGGGFSAFIPSFAKPIVEVATNKSWTGMPIYKDTPYNKNDPEWTKAYSSTDQHLVAAAKWLNEQTGGDDYKKGWADINPAKVEYLLNGTFGGMVSFPNKIKKSAETAAGKRDFEWRNMPILNRVVKSGDERTAYRKTKEQFFKFKEEHDETKRLLGKYNAEASKDIVKYAEKINFLYYSDEYLRFEIYEFYKPDLDAAYTFRTNATGDEEKRQAEEFEQRTQRIVVDAMKDPKGFFDSQGLSTETLREKRQAKLDKSVKTKETKVARSKKRVEKGLDEDD